MSELIRKVYSIADNQNYMGMDRSQSNQFQTELFNDHSLKELASSEGKEWTRTYIKDTLLNAYSKEKRYIETSDIFAIIPELSSASIYSKKDPNDAVLVYKLNDLLIGCTCVSIDKWETAIRRFDKRYDINIAFITLGGQSKLTDQAKIAINQLEKNDIKGLVARPNQDPITLQIPQKSEPAHAGLKNNPEIDISEMISNFLDNIKESGFKFSENQIRRLTASLIAKKFCILSGLSGSGKTKLAEALALWLCKNPNEQIKIIAVGADWTSNEALLGYPDALTTGQYKSPSHGLIDHIHKAASDSANPYFLILDEMNLSHVERYFSDFLSAMESTQKEIHLHDDGDLKSSSGLAINSKIILPNNLFIIGTINVDETTYMFSPKVLDRANVIEFRVENEDMFNFISNMRNSNLKFIESKGSNFGEAFTLKANSAFDQDNGLGRNFDAETFNRVQSTLANDLMELFTPLAEAGAEFGYRTASEISRFIWAYLDMTKNEGDYTDALDAQIVQKIMPKLHGSSRKLNSILEALNTYSEQKSLKLTKNKASRMLQRLQRDGFTSFAEN